MRSEVHEEALDEDGSQADSESTSTSTSDSSSISSSSESDSSDNEDSDGQPGLARAQPSLHDRFNAFLPQMNQGTANPQQSGNAATSGFEVVLENSEEEDEGYSSEAEDGPYIEMNLGLGVLEDQAGIDTSGDIKLPSISNDEVNESRKRKAEDSSDDADEISVLAQLSNVGRESEDSSRREKRAKRSKIEVVDRD